MRQGLSLNLEWFISVRLAGLQASDLPVSALYVGITNVHHVNVRTGDLTLGLHAFMVGNPRAELVPYPAFNPLLSWLNKPIDADVD